MGEQPLLEVVGLGKAFAGVDVLREVGFHVEAGEAVAIIGPNGAGKSTLLRCLIGAEQPDEGTVLLDGEPLDESSAATRAAVAALLDDVDFFPDLSVVEHLRLYAWAHGEPDPEEVVARVLTDLRLDQARDQLPGTLSSGQRHRLGLASCLVRPRRLLVLDEPEARLDAAGREWLADRLNREKELGTAVVFASHSAELTRQVADGIVEFDR